jgi:hypothetical protein
MVWVRGVDSITVGMGDREENAIIKDFCISAYIFSKGECRG